MSALPEVVDLDVKYHTQINNEHNPDGTCNVTSIAMALAFYKKIPEIKGKQLEDRIYEWIIANGMNYQVPQHLEMAANYFGTEYGIRDRFVADGSIELAKQHLASGNPVVTAGYFTPPGHVVLLKGYNLKGFIVHDPYGEWFEDGYRNFGQGANLLYSFDLIRRTCVISGEIWLHLFSLESKPQR